MRRIKLFLLVAASISAIALVVFPSIGSAGGKPDRVQLTDEGNSFDLPAGIACSFELASTPVSNNEYIKTFPADANGDVRQILTGKLVSQLTNVDTGKSITVQLSGPGQFLNHADGSTTADLQGANLVIFFPTDTPAGPATYLFKGRTVLSFDADGNETLISATDKKPLDLCAALS